MMQRERPSPTATLRACLILDSKDRRGTRSSFDRLGAGLFSAPSTPATSTGGTVGILASPGMHGLRIKDTSIRKTRTAILSLPGTIGRHRYRTSDPLNINGRDRRSRRGLASIRRGDYRKRRHRHCGLRQRTRSSAATPSSAPRSASGWIPGRRVPSSCSISPASITEHQPESEFGAKPIIDILSPMCAMRSSSRSIGRVQDRMERLHALAGVFQMRVTRNASTTRITDGSVEMLANDCRSRSILGLDDR